MHSIILFLGGAVATLLIATDALLAYEYGASFGGQLGHLFAIVFSASVMLSPALPVAFSSATGDVLRRCVVIGLIVVCVACNVTTRYLAISWRQAAELQTSSDVSTARESMKRLDGVRRPEAIRHEILMLGRPDTRTKREHSVKLANELSASLERDRLRSIIDSSAPGALSGLTSLDGRFGLPAATWALIMSLIYIVGSEAIGSFGLYAVTRRKMIKPDAPPATNTEAQAPEVPGPAVTESPPAVEPEVIKAEVVSDPVAKFIAERVVRDDRASTPYDEILAAWHSWAEEKSIAGTGVNLGLILKAHGFSAGTTAGRNKRRTYKGLSIAA